MKNHQLLLPLALTLGVSLGAVAQTTQSTPSKTPNTGSSMTGGQSAPAAQPGTGTRNAETNKDDKLARGDRKFMQKAAESGMFEVQIAQLAQSKAKDPAVKSFADMLVKEHSAANDELVKLANSKRVELPAAPPKGKRNDIEKMGKRTADFDEHFVREVGIKDHQKDIKDFEKASKDVKDPELKAWVDKTLPHLRDHLAMAQKLPQAGRGGADAASMGNRSSGMQGDVHTGTAAGAATGTNTGKKTGS